MGFFEFNLDLVSVELMSLGVALPLSMRFTFPGVREMRAQLRSVSVTLAFGSTVWRWLNIYCTPTTLAVMRGLFGPMTTGMVGLINDLCVKFQLVVGVATFGSLLRSLFGSLLATTNFSESLNASTC